MQATMGQPMIAMVSAEPLSKVQMQYLINQRPVGAHESAVKVPWKTNNFGDDKITKKKK